MSKQKSVLNGFLAGALGGVVGTLTLNVFQKASLEATRLVESKADTDQRYTRQQEELLSSFETAHTHAAEDLARVAGSSLPEGQRKAAAPVMEFVFGVGCAAVYGALAEYLPFLSAGYGSIYGASLFVGAAEAVLPAMHYVPPVADRTPVQHAGGLSGNIVYGVTTEAVRRLLRK